MTEDYRKAWDLKYKTFALISYSNSYFALANK